VVTGNAKLKISILNGTTTRNVTLKQVLFCPDLAFTLISLMKCDTAGYSMLLKDHKRTISDLHGTVLGQVSLTRDLYQHQYIFQTDETVNVAHKVLSLDQLHRKMGHIPPCTTRELVKNGTVTGLNLDMRSEASFCNACAKAKPVCKPVPKEYTSLCATNVGNKILSDIWGPATPQSHYGKEDFVIFTDDYSRWSHIETMSHKSETLTQYKNYEAG